MYVLEVFENGEWKFATETFSVYTAIEVFRSWIWAGIECRISSPPEYVLKERMK